MRRNASTWAIVMNLSMWSDMADVITHVNFYVNWFWGLRVLTAPNLHYSIGLGGRSYISATLSYNVCCITKEQKL